MVDQELPSRRQDQNMRPLRTDELDLWLQFLADAFGNKHPNMLELFRMLIDKDKHFHVEDILLLGQLPVRFCGVRTCYVLYAYHYRKGFCLAEHCSRDT